MITDLVVKVSLTGAGSAVMWFLVLLSIISLTVVIERWVFFVKNSGAADLLAQQIGGKLAAGETEEAKKYSKRDWFRSQSGERGLRGVSQRQRSHVEMAQSTAKVEAALRKRPRIFGDAGKQRAFHRPVRDRTRDYRCLGEMGTLCRSGGCHCGDVHFQQLWPPLRWVCSWRCRPAFYITARRLKSLNTGAEALLHVVLPIDNQLR